MRRKQATSHSKKSYHASILGLRFERDSNVFSDGSPLPLPQVRWRQTAQRLATGQRTSTATAAEEACPPRPRSVSTREVAAWRAAASAERETRRLPPPGLARSGGLVCP